MHALTTSVAFATFAALSAAPCLAQHLRLGLLSSEIVVVADHLGMRPLGNDRFVHSYQTHRVLKGRLSEDATTTAPIKFSIIELKRVADAPKPQGFGRVLCCLGRAPDLDTSLPGRFAPYFRLSGYQGDHVAVAQAADPLVEFASQVIAAGSGALEPAEAAAEFAASARAGASTVRLEAIGMLRESPVLREALTEEDRRALLVAAVAENDDVPLKNSLASLCVECKTPRVVETLRPALRQIADRTFARTMARLARLVHGDDAVAILAAELGEASTASERVGILAAVGATQSEAGLNLLRRLQRSDGPSAAITAGLREHDPKSQRR